MLAMCLSLGGIGCDENPEEAVRQLVSAYCTADVFPLCDGGSALRITVGGSTTQSTYVWAALERDGAMVAHGLGRPMLAGTFENCPLEIELTGLNLEANCEYDLMIYQTDDPNDIGNPRDRATATGPSKVSFTPGQTAQFAAGARKTATALVTSRATGGEYCLVTGQATVMHLVPADLNGGWELAPMPCTTAIDTCTTLEWTLGGNAYPRAVLASGYGVLLPLHKTVSTDDCWLKVTDTASGADIRRSDSISIGVEYPTDVGYRLGSASNWVDTLVEEFADSIGFIPQLLKAQIRQEAGANLDTLAYRYEPRYDYNYISVGVAGTYRLTQQPYSWYRLSAPAENGHAAVARGDSLDNEDEIRGQNYYSGVWDDNGNGYLSAWEYIENNAGQWHCDASQCPPSSIDFTAQTAIASSYGLMQLMWPSTWVYGANWNDGDAGDPHLLFDPELSLRLASRVLRHHFTALNWSGSWSTYEDAVDSTLVRYNQGSTYHDDVRQWMDDFQIEWTE